MNFERQIHPEMQRWKGSQRRIGLTGGIASGKSSVGRFLKEVYGFPIVDADVFAKQALAPGSPLTNAVIKRYGKVVIDKNQLTLSVLDRSALAKIIFENTHERTWLEGLIHPFVLDALNERILELQHLPVIVIIAPLLFEARLTCLCSEVWLVYCTLSQQVERVIERDGLSISEATQRINSQWNVDKKKQFSDILIDNTHTPNEWESLVKSLF